MNQHEFGEAHHLDTPKSSFLLGSCDLQHHPLEHLDYLDQTLLRVQAAIEIREHRMSHTIDDCTVLPSGVGANLRDWQLLEALSSLDCIRKGLGHGDVEDAHVDASDDDDREAPLELVLSERREVLTASSSVSREINPDDGAHQVVVPKASAQTRNHELAHD